MSAVNPEGVRRYTHVDGPNATYVGSEEEHVFRAPSRWSTAIPDAVMTPPAEAPPAWPEPHAAPLAIVTSVVPGDEHTVTMYRAEIVGLGLRKHAATAVGARLAARRDALRKLTLCVEREEGPPAAHAALALLFGGTAPREPTDLPTRPVYTPAPDPHADMSGSPEAEGSR